MGEGMLLPLTEAGTLSLAFEKPPHEGDRILADTTLALQPQSC